MAANRTELRHSDASRSPRGLLRRGVRACCVAVLLGICAIGMPRAMAVDITGYSSAANDRFSSGFPTNPVSNTDPTLVGRFDWSGVGWDASNATKGFGFITPRHFLYARHYGGASSITVVGGDGQLHSVTQEAWVDTGYGANVNGSYDLSIGQLTGSMPKTWGIARYGVLDVNQTSSTNSVYGGAWLFVYGRGPDASTTPRIGLTRVASTALGGNYSYITTGTANVQLQVGDSGSPVFIPWKNPNGAWEPTILGNNAGVSSGTNFMSYIANSTVMGAVNDLVTSDGYALRVVGNVGTVWTGSAALQSGQHSIAAAGNWGGGLPTDLYAGLQANGTAARTIDVDTPADIRGLFVGATLAGPGGFTVSGSSTLTIGRGGLTNYAAERQVFTANLKLGDDQYWDVGSGGVTATDIDTNGRLLEIDGSGTATIVGAVSGSGGIALTGSRLEMTGSSSYSGATWVHGGKLVVNGDISASSGVIVEASGSLGGSGSVGAISGAGSIDPGNSPGILTATSVDPTGGIDFNFEFGQLGAPNWGNATASGNDVLRLTDPTQPFAGPLGSGNVVSIFLDVNSLSYHDAFCGGFFTDRDESFYASIVGASYDYYLADPTGGTLYNGHRYSRYSGPLHLEMSVIPVTAGFSGGSEAGYAMELVAVPEPGTVCLAIAGVATACLARGLRRRKA